MRRRYNLAHLILASVVVLGLTLLMVYVDVQAQIAFMSQRDGNAEIYVMDTDGGNQRRLTNNRHDDWNPSWSPDGKRIVFFSNRDGHVIDGRPTTEIYVMDADGGNQQNLTNHPGDDHSPSWSPDGKQIAFSSFRRDRDGNLPHFDIYVMDTDGGNQQRLTNNRKNDWNPSWSPDGKQIAFESDRKGDLQNFEIYVMDADGQNLQNLTNNRVDDGSPSWSPDGKRIAFASDRSGNFRSYEIYVIDADGQNLQNLTNHPHNDFSPVWFGPAFAVAPAGKTLTIWGELKQVDR